MTLAEYAIVGGILVVCFLCGFLFREARMLRHRVENQHEQLVQTTQKLGEVQHDVVTLTAVTHTATQETAPAGPDDDEHVPALQQVYRTMATPTVKILSLGTALKKTASTVWSSRSQGRTK